MGTNFLFGKTRTGRATAFAFGAAMIFAVVLFGLQAANPAHAVTRPPFTVNSIGDEADKKPGDGVCQITTADQCTLRAAIEEANSSSSADTINFAIPGAGPHTIAPASKLPPITQPVTIDGYTESLDEGANPAKPNTASTGTDAVLKIVLDGTNVVVPPFQVNVTGLELSSGASNSVIRGLVINDFHSRAIYLTSGTSKVEGNFLGTDPTGTAAEGNGVGVSIAGSSLASTNNTIGGTQPAQRNLISGNVFGGIQATGGPGGNKIEGNLIGTDKSGANDLHNGTGKSSDAGVYLHAAPNYTIGDSDPSDGATNAANTIAFNAGDGVFISESQSVGNRILPNSIHSNDRLGIDLVGNFGVTANDPKDPDTGPNNLQNFPVITSAQVFPDPLIGTTTSINGTLNSTPSTKKKKRTFIIQFFSSPAADTSGNGEGKTFLGQTQVTTNRQGDVKSDTGTFSFVAKGNLSNNYITATATNKKTGDTSEFSNALFVPEPSNG